MSALVLTGAVLVGGESRRFGRDKAGARVGGVPLALRAWRAVAALTPNLHLVGGRGATVGHDLAFLADARPGQGPLAGIEAALAHAREVGARGVVVLACDLPLVDPPALATLVRAWHAASAPEAVVALCRDPAQPLAAVWGVGLLPRVREALEAGRRRVVDLIATVDTVPVPAGVLGAAVGLQAGEVLHNVNRPGQLEGVPAAVLPPVVSVAGWKDSGKTSAAVALLQALARRGIRAVAAKHGHGFRLDHPGTDSWRLRHETEAQAVLLAGPEGEVLQRVAAPGSGEAPLAALIRRHLPGAALVVAEGWKNEGWLTIEVQGAEPGEAIVRAGGPEAGRALARVTGGPAAARPEAGDELAAALLARFPGLA